MAPAVMPRDSGMGAGVHLSYKNALIIIVFLALAVYNAIEIIARIFTTFRSYRGVYFWSCLASASGIVIHALGYFLRNYDIVTSVPLEITLVGIGAIGMVTGQSIVLWSRLHLISRGRRHRWLLAMIIVDCIVGQIGALTLFAGTNGPNPEPYLKIFGPWERFQITLFFVQECLISGLYMYRTWRLVSESGVFRGKEGKRTLTHLVMVNMLVVALDITILAFQYANMYDIQTSWKTLAYSIKLKFEFNILNRLIELTKHGLGGTHAAGSRRPGESSTTGGTGTIDKSAVRKHGYGNHSTYERMQDEGGIPLKEVGNVVKTTEITVNSVKIDDDGDALSEGSTKALREESRVKIVTAKPSLELTDDKENQTRLY